MNRTHESGVAHLVLILIVVVVIGGGVGYLAWQNLVVKKSSDVALDAATKAARDECEKDNDKDICRFMTNWKVGSKYRMTTVSGNNKTVFEIDGDNSHMMTTGDTSYDVISIGKNTTYTKAGNTWYKQTLKDPSQNPTAGGKVEFKESTDDTKTDNTPKTTYKSLGKEACGNLTCFKYEVVDPTATDTHELLWFDTQDYKLRKTETQASDGTTVATFDYDNVTVSVPSPVKELAANQYIVPGQSEPQTMPDMSAYQQQLQQLQQQQ